MSNQIIPVFTGIINKEETQLVNAQLLHSFLEVETRFNDWISRRISEYQFVENIDFILVTQKRVIKSRGGDRRSKDYHLTMDMAKELSMVERTEKGRQARKYFIECEKRLMQILKPETINTEQKYSIRKAVNERVHRTGEHHQTIYHKFYDHFKINSYENLPASKFDEAIKFLGGVFTSSKLSDEDWFDLAWLYKAAEHMRFNCERILPALQAINSSYYSEFWSLAKDHKHALEYARIIIERETAHISDKGFTNKWNTVLPVIRHTKQLR